MSPHADHNRHVRQVVLPSGRTIEVVYFEDQRASRREPAGADLPAPRHAVDMHVCPVCSSELVYPVDWEEAGETQWEVSLRCPECEWGATGIYEQEAVERFDMELDRGTDDLMRDLQALSRANMEESVERFLFALQHGHIIPADF